MRRLIAMPDMVPGVVSHAATTGIVEAAAMNRGAHIQMVSESSRRQFSMSLQVVQACWADCGGIAARSA